MIRKEVAYIAVSNELLIDAGLGTPEMIEAEKARQAEWEKKWRALPWRTKAARRLKAWRWGQWHDWREGLALRIAPWLLRREDV